MKWLVGQEVKTPPSHGGITGSIPVRAADCKRIFNSPTLESVKAYALALFFFLNRILVGFLSVSDYNIESIN